MSVQIEDLSPVQKKLSFVVDKESVDAKLSEAYRVLSKQVRIHGFRAGKVPRRVLEQRYGRHILGEVGGQVISDAYDTAIAEHKLVPVSQPVVEQGTLLAGVDYSFSVTVEVKPSLAAQGWDGLDVEWERVEVSEEQLGRELEQLRERSGTFEVAEASHKVASGDLALVDVSFNAEGMEEHSLSRYAVQAGEDAYGMPLSVWLAPKVLGLETGGKLAFDETIPDGTLAPAWNGVSAAVTLLVAEVKTQKLPELNDEFAKDEGFDSIDLLKADLRFKLEEHMRQHVRAHAAEFALTRLVELNDFEVPLGLVRAEAEALIAQQFRQFAQAGMKMPQIRLENLAEEARNSFLAQGEQSVRRALILESVAELAEVEVSDADVDEKIEEMAVEFGQQPSAIKGLLLKRGGLDDLRGRIRESKALDLILERANIIDVEPTDHSHHEHGFSDAAVAEESESPAAEAAEPAPAEPGDDAAVAEEAGQEG